MMADTKNEFDVADQIVAFKRKMAPKRDVLKRAYDDVRGEVMRAADKIRTDNAVGRPTVPELAYADVKAGKISDATREAIRKSGPVPEKGLDVLLVQLDAPIRQTDTLPLHQGQDREEQRVGGQASNSGVALNGLEQRDALLGRLLFGHGRLASRRPLERCRPLDNELGDVGVLELTSVHSANPFHGRPDVAVPDDAAREQELVALAPVHGEEVNDAVDHDAPAAEVAHLVEPVEEQHGFPAVSAAGASGPWAT